MGKITINSKRLFTLYPDGTELTELLFSSEWDKNRIGEYKKIEIECSTTQELADSVIYFSPALFFDLSGFSPFTFGGVPTEGFAYVVDSTATMGTYTMAPFNNPPYPEVLLKNWEVEIQIGYGNDFKIIMKYYQLEDRQTYYNSSNQYNHNKLLKDKVSSVAELTVSPASVYTTTKWGIKAYIYQASIEDAAVNSFKETPFDFYRAGFYNKNALQTAPYFSTPVWALSDTGGARTTLSLLQDTKVTFDINAPTLPKHWFVWMIRTDTADNTVDFKTNYEASFLEIITTGGSSTLDNKIKSPAVFLTFVSGTTYQGSHYVDKTLLEANGKYRFISIVYDPVVMGVNSFISDEYSVSLPTFTSDGYLFEGLIKDYQQDFTGNDLICVVEERLRSTCNIDFSAGVFSDDMFNRLGLTVSNDIRRYLKRVTMEIYEDLPGDIRQYFARENSLKIDPTTYSGSAIGLNFALAGNLNVRYTFRNRYEANVLNIETRQLGTALLTPTANQNWAGRDLRIEWQFELFYDDYSTPFSDVIRFIQKLHPQGYTSDVQIFKEDGNAIGQNEYFCSEEETCCKAKCNLANPELYKLITTIEKNTGSIVTIKENEEWAGSGVLPQLDATEFFDQETLFSETEATFAKFCINNNQLDNDILYKVSAIAKKTI